VNRGSTVARPCVTSFSACRRPATARGARLEAFQSNQEGALIDRVHAAKKQGIAYIIVNPAGSRTAASRCVTPSPRSPSVLEVHLSNIHAREPFRRHSYFSDVAVGRSAGWEAGATTWRSTTRLQLGAKLEIGPGGPSPAQGRIRHGSAQTQEADRPRPGIGHRRARDHRGRGEGQDRQRRAGGAGGGRDAARAGGGACNCRRGSGRTSASRRGSAKVEGHVLKSPMVGTFYRAPSPGAKRSWRWATR